MNLPATPSECLPRLAMCTARLCWRSLLRTGESRLAPATKRARKLSLPPLSPYLPISLSLSLSLCPNATCPVQTTCNIRPERAFCVHSNRWNGSSRHSSALHICAYSRATQQKAPRCHGLRMADGRIVCTGAHAEQGQQPRGHSHTHRPSQQPLQFDSIAILATADNQRDCFVDSGSA